ncbi:MAG: hypothetical protein AB1405_05465, partial [Bdellovibrionota bacterium]
TARFQAETPFDALCIDFVRSRVYLALPEPFGKPEEGRKGLERILDTLRGRGRAKLEPSFEGELEVLEVTINYFLAEAARIGGEKGRARDHYRRVLELDPASDFGSKAFVHLGELE